MGISPAYLHPMALWGAPAARIPSQWQKNYCHCHRSLRPQEEFHILSYPDITIQLIFVSLRTQSTIIKEILVPHNNPCTETQPQRTCQAHVTEERQRRKPFTGSPSHGNPMGRGEDEGTFIRASEGIHVVYLLQSKGISSVIKENIKGLNYVISSSWEEEIKENRIVPLTEIKYQIS